MRVSPDSVVLIGTEAPIKLRRRSTTVHGAIYASDPPPPTKKSTLHSAES